MRVPGKFALGLVITPATIVAMAITSVLTFGWNRAKSYLNDRVSQTVGRPFAINGDLMFTWKKPEDEPGWRAYASWPRFIANDITARNPDWAKQPNVAAIRQLMLILGASPLLVYRIVIPSTTLGTPAITLECDKQNRSNWISDLTRGEDNNKKPSGQKLDLHGIAFSRGSLTLDDDIKCIHLTATVDTIDNQTLYIVVNGTAIKNVDQPVKELAASGAVTSATAAQTPTIPDPQQPHGIVWTVKGTYSNAVVTGSGKANGVLHLQGAQRPYPLQTDVMVDKTHIDLADILTNPTDLTAIDLRLYLSGASMAQLYPLTGVVLPDMSLFDTRGKPVGGL